MEGVKIKIKTDTNTPTINKILTNSRVVNYILFVAHIIAVTYLRSCQARVTTFGEVAATVNGLADRLVNGTVLPTTGKWQA